MLNLETATKKYKQFDTIYKEFEVRQKKSVYKKQNNCNF